MRLPAVPQLLLALSVALPCLGVLAGCQTSQAQDGRTTLRFTYYGTVDDLQAWDDLVTRFEAENPDLRIKQEHIAGQAYNSKLMAMTVGNVAPDVMFSDDEYFSEMAVNGLFEPLDSYLAREPSLSPDHFYTPFYETWNWNGVQWAVPSHGHCLVIYYNRELLRDANLPDPPADWTWDDFVAYGKKLTIDRDGNGRPEQFGALFPSWAHSLSWIWSMGGEFISPDRQRCLLDSPRAIAGLDFQYQQLQRHHMVPSIGELPGMHIDAMFMNGKVAMALHGTWWLDQAKNAPNLQWDVQHLPLAPNPDYPEGHRETRATCEGLAISSRSQHKEEAWRWIKFILSDPSQELLAHYGRGIPAIRAVAERAFPNPDTPQREEVFLEAMEYARPQNVHPRFVETMVVFNREWDLMRLGERNTADACRIVAQEINAILQEER